MVLSSQQRRWMLGSALLLTLAAVWAVQQADEPAGYIADQKHASSNARLDKPNLTPGMTAAISRVAIAENPGSTRYRQASQQGILPEIAERRKMAIPAGQPQTHPDLLGAHAWYVPPVAQTVVYTPVEKPMAPPAPFQYMGKLEYSPQGTLIFLASGSGTGSTGLSSNNGSASNPGSASNLGSAINKVQSVIPGQLINSAWRLDSEDASALYLTYLPLGTAQVLSKTAKRLPANAEPTLNQTEANQPEASQSYANQIDANQLSNNNN